MVPGRGGKQVFLVQLASVPKAEEVLNDDSFAETSSQTSEMEETEREMGKAP